MMRDLATSGIRDNEWSILRSGVNAQKILSFNKTNNINLMRYIYENQK